jgi:hypothetical protein
MSRAIGVASAGVEFGVRRSLVNGFMLAKLRVSNLTIRTMN